MVDHGYSGWIPVDPGELWRIAVGYGGSLVYFLLANKTCKVRAALHSEPQNCAGCTIIHRNIEECVHDAKYHTKKLAVFLF